MDIRLAGEVDWVFRPGAYLTRIFRVGIGGAMGRPKTMTVYQWNGNNYCAECAWWPVAEALGVGEWATEEGIGDLPARAALREIARQAGVRQADVIRPMAEVQEWTFCSDCTRFFVPPGRDPEATA